MPLSKKTTFIALIILTTLLLVLVVAGLYALLKPGLAIIHPQAPAVIFMTLGVLLGIGIIGVLLLVLTILLGKEIFWGKGFRGILIRILFPLTMLVGNLFGISRERVQQSFVEVNNLLVRALCRDKKPDRVLLLMPHCLQFSDCDIKITTNAQKCRACGKCRIKELVELADRYQVDLSIATGGTLARRRITETKPKVVIAVACERDLTSGIQDAFPLPVIGILNDRPFGPCVNTSVDISKVAHALEFLTGGR
ncbi:MAG: DUF116 domain-containing protein [Nitrospirota bacterium]